MATPKTVLGGDDVRAIVVDCGSWVTRVGTAGDDTPRAIIPSAVAYRHADSTTKPDVAMTDAPTSLTSPSAPAPTPSSNLNAETVGKPVPIAGDILLTSPTIFRHVQHVNNFDPTTGTATVSDWDAMQAVWQSAFSTLRLTPHLSPLLIIEPTRLWNTVDRSHALERAFEGCNVPAAYIARGSAMAAFASARTTACVLDIGYQGACAVPVVDGYALQKRCVGSIAGGLHLSQQLAEWAELCLEGRLNYDGSERRSAKRARNSDPIRNEWLRSHHELKKERIPSDNVVRQYNVTDLCVDDFATRFTDGHRAFYRLRVMDEMKGTAFQVSQTKSAEIKDVKDAKDAKGKKKDDGIAQNGADKDAKDVKDAKDSKDRGKEKGSLDGGSSFILPDGNVLSLEEHGGYEIADRLFTTKEESGMTSVSDLVMRCVSGCDVDLRRDLFGGVVITGGTSMVPGVVERLTRELALMIPQAYKLKVIAPTNSIERSCAAWIGGSIVSSLGTFQQAWISKAEYDELGAVKALRKCP